MGVNIVNSGYDIRFDCVDTWVGSVEHTDATEKAELYDKFVNNIECLLPECDLRWIRKESVVAAKDYEDGSLDFVFLDAAHDADSVHADIQAWRPKLKVEGVLAGDDAAFMGVREGLIRAGVGIPENPVTVSGGTYKSWMLVPGHMQKEWDTPIPSYRDLCSVEGGFEAAAEVLAEVLPGENDAVVQSTAQRSVRELSDWEQSLTRLKGGLAR